MNYNAITLPLAFVGSFLLTACDPNFTNPVDSTDNTAYTAGKADFSNYVAIGDSLTAGYADGALSLNAQKNSFPAILAQQFSKVGGGAFTQPLMDDDLGGLVFGGTPDSTNFPNRLVLNGTTSSPEPISGTPTNEIAIGAPTAAGTYNNLGVPGAKSFHLASSSYGDVAGLGASTANPYYVRFAASTTTSVITQAVTQAPTFFSLWIGNNDVLSYATSGGIGTDQTGNINPATYGSNDITDPNVFANTLNGFVTALTSNPATKGVLVNIPDVSSIPYFTTVPYNPLTPSKLDSATITALNTAYAAYNAGLQQMVGLNVITAEEATKRTITFTEGTNNAVVILDEDLTDLTGYNAALVSMRQATAEDLLVLTSSSKIGTLKDSNDPTSAWGIGVPLEDGDVLVKSEQNAIKTATTAFNATIKTITDNNANLALFDVNALMANLKANNINFGTGVIKATYATGGGFSLDGVHPTQRGYAVVANAIIDVINSNFESTIPHVDPGAYPTIFLK